MKLVGPYKQGKEYPLISWVQAGAWAEAIEPYSVDEIDEWFESDTKVLVKPLVACRGRLDDSAYWP